MMNYNIYLNNRNMDKCTSKKALIIGLLYFSSFFLVFLLPNYITNYFKLITIILLLLLIVSSDKFYVSSEAFIIFLLTSYQIIIWIFYQNSFMSLSKIAVFVLILIVIISNYNKNDLYFISNMVFWGTLIYSFGIILSNNIFSPINRGNVNFINIPINANGLPQVLMPGIILILSKIFSFKKVSLFNYLALICCSIVILYSASRTGLFSLGFALLLFFIYSTKNRKIVIILLIFLSLFFLAFYEFDVFLRVFKFDFSGRIELWKEAIELSQKNIIFGNGFDYYKENTNFSFGDYGCHNAFLDVLMSNGLIGLSLILLLFIVIIYKGIKQKTVIALMSSTIISMMLESAINYPFIISITLCILINRHRNYEFTYERSKYVF